MKANIFEYAKILVIGAGGLGCEILVDLAQSGIRDIHIIDLDKIDVTNLNRQFLFRMKDVGQYKSDVAAAFVRERYPGINVTSYTNPIQEFDEDFYRQFQIVIAGLDNVEARSWMNQTLHNMVAFDPATGEPDPETIIHLIDGGTEGFKGQARVIVPFKSGCYECTLASLPPATTFPICTVKETPRLPEHCVAYGLMVAWEKEFPDKPKPDTDSPEDMKWLYECAKTRAEAYNIQGVTYNLTLGVAKNIIPAIASTNAIISAACTNEVVKILTGSNLKMDNYYQYMG